MLFEGVISGLIIGLLRGGKLLNLERAQPRGLYLAIISFLIQLALWVGFFWGGDFFGAAKPVLHLISYLPLLWFGYLNRRSLGLLTIGIGMLLNLAAIAANGGYMPADSNKLDPAYRQELAEGSYSPFHRAITRETRLYPLTDIIRLPYGKHKLISIGDIMITAGLIYFIQHGMGLKKKDEAGE
ncbi:MAG: DUF5317 domain-containing protein [Bacillota bacterium]